MTDKNIETEVFEKIIPMTTPERELVKKWVEEGNSPFTNPFGLINLDGGCMLNFIQALKEYPDLEFKDSKTAKRLGLPDIVQIKELAVPGWENACKGLSRVRI